MATTTATVSISSNDLMPGSSLGISASSTLMKTGLTTGMTQVQTGAMSLATGTEYSLWEATGTANSANFIYICNTSTDDTYYVDWGIHETMIGRLYAGDWMFIPWNASDDAAEIEIEAQVGTQTIEYAFFASDLALATAAS